MNRGMYCFLPITIMVIAKPSAGRILPAIARPFVDQAGSRFTKEAMASGPYRQAMNTGTKRIGKANRRGYIVAARWMPLYHLFCVAISHVDKCGIQCFTYVFQNNAEQSQWNSQRDSNFWFNTCGKCNWNCYTRG